MSDGDANSGGGVTGDVDGGVAGTNDGPGVRARSTGGEGVDDADKGDGCWPVDSSRRSSNGGVSHEGVVRCGGGGSRTRKACRTRRRWSR